MFGSEPLKKPVSRVALWAATTALACLFAAGVAPAFGQTTDELKAALAQDPNARLLLVSDELIYDQDNQLVVAKGGVQIDYAGNKLVARQVTYDQNSGRLMAEGNVEIVEKDGNRIYSEKIDITDDFSDGFANALRVETIDNTRFCRRKCHARRWQHHHVQSGCLHSLRTLPRKSG